MSFTDFLSNLPFFKGKDEKKENYFGLYISYNSVFATVWTIEKNNLVILNSAHASFENEDNFKSDKTLQALADAANYCLDEALADIIPEPTQLLFGVPEPWLQNENILPEYLKILKKLVKELDVTPMAYVSTPHAIAHLLQKQQGIPLTAILIELSDPLVINVIKAGKTLATVLQKRGDHLGKDIEKGLYSIDNIEVLPSKILLYGNPDIEKAKIELSSFPWMNQLPFLHLPRVDILEQSVAVHAICFAGGFELFPNISPKIVDYSLVKADTSSRLSHKVELNDEVKQIRHNRIPQEALEAGFADDETEGDNYTEVFDEQGTEGVSEEEDWEEEELERDELMRSQSSRKNLPYSSHQPLGEGGIKQKIMAPFMALTRGGGITPHNRFLAFLTNKVIIIPLAAIVVLAVLLIFFTHATVTMYVDMKTQENTSEVIADPSVSNVDVANKVIPGKILQTDETGSDSGTATGTKQVGDPAKGTVVIYNKTDSPKTFSEGTVLIGPKNLQFTLDSTVNVASQSAVEGGIEFGKATGNVTAGAIGPDSNLSAGTNLTIQNQASDQYSAQVDQALAGGVSKEVTVVTTDDQKRLLAQVSSTLRSKAQQDLQSQLTGDEKILADSLIEQIKKSSYSKNVGDQASSFSLNLTANYKGTAYSEADLKSVLAQIAQINNSQNGNFQIDMSTTKTQSDVSKVDKSTGKLYFNAKLIAQLKPTYDEALIKKQIAGKSINAAIEQLKSLDNVIDATIQLSPPLPGPLQRLPFLTKNISLVVKTK